MQKTSQRRGILNKIRETVDVPGRLTEKYFNPEFKDIMDKLRILDDNVRSITIGAKYGDSDAPTDPISLKALLKLAKSNAGKREYMKSVAQLGRFHKKIFDIVTLLTKFNYSVDAAHEKFLFNDLDDESKSHLQSFKNRWAPKAASYKYDLISKAGLLDMFTETELGKAFERRRALSSWEKRYPSKVKDLKLDTIAIINESEKLLGVLLASLSQMDTARAARNPENYMKISNKIIDAFKKYDDGDKGFKNFYEKNVKGFLEKQEFFAPTKIDNSNKPQELGNQNISFELDLPKKQNPSTVDDPNILNEPPTNRSNTVFQSPMNVSVPISNGPVSGDGKTEPNPVPPQHNPGETISTDNPQMNLNFEKANPVMNPGYPVSNLRKQTPEELQHMEEFNKKHDPNTAVAHQDFYESLQRLANDAPQLMGPYIKKYAKYIQSKDLNTAIELFKLAKSIEV